MNLLIEKWQKPFVMTQGALQKFTDVPGFHTYACLARSEGRAELRRLRGNDIPVLATGDWALRIAANPPSTKLRFETHTEDGHDCAIRLNVSAQVQEPLMLLDSIDLNLLREQGSLKLETVLMNALQDRVRDEIRGLTFATLKHKDALPNSWWQSILNDHAAWATLQVSELEYASLSGSEALQQASQQAFENQRQAAIAQQQKLEQQLEQDQRAHQQSLAQIAANEELSDIERRQQAELDAIKHQHEKLQIEAAIEKLHSQMQADKTSQAAGLARLHDQQAEAESILAEHRQQADEAKQQQHNLQTQIEQLRKTLDTGELFLREGYQVGVKTLLDQGEQATETIRAIFPQDVKKQAMASVIQKAQIDFGKVRFGLEQQMSAMRSRSIVVTQPKAGVRPTLLNRMQPGAPLNFEIKVSQTGYLTVFNIGVENYFNLLAPNYQVCGENTLLLKPGDEDSLTFRFPSTHADKGDPFLPQVTFENGETADLEFAVAHDTPLGGEEFIGIIITSAEQGPLFSEAEFDHTSAYEPLYQNLDDARIATFVERLQSLKANQWQAGYFSFLVDDCDDDR